MTKSAYAVLVTGGAGFIGSNLVRHLEGLGVSVTVLDDFSTGSGENLRGRRARVLEGSILDRSVLDEAMADVRTVVHLAARPSVPRSLQDPLASHHANATGTIEVLEAARRHGNPHVIVASSSSVYGANPALPKTEHLRPLPVSPYAVSKLATETYASVYNQCFGLNTLAFRFFNVYGPGQPADHAYAAVIPAFVSAALSDQPIVVHGDGLQTRDFTYVGTVVEALARAIVEGTSDVAPVNLAFGTRASLLDVIDLLEDHFGRRLPRQHVDPRPGDVRDSQAGTDRLLSLFPDIEAVGLREGLLATINWMRDVTHGGALDSGGCG